MRRRAQLGAPRSSPSLPACAPQVQRSLGQHRDVLALLISPLLSQAGRDVPCIVPSHSSIKLLCAPNAPQAAWGHPSLGTSPGDTPGGSALFPSGSSLWIHGFFFGMCGSRELSSPPGKSGCQPLGWHSPGWGGECRALLLPRVSANVSWEQAFLVGFKRSYEIASISEPLSSNSKAFKYSRK